MNSDNPRLHPSDFHRHWFYDPVNHPGPQQLPAFHHIQDPDINTRHVKARRIAPKSSTLRGLTAAELQDEKREKDARQRQKQTQPQTQPQTQIQTQTQQQTQQLTLTPIMRQKETDPNVIWHEPCYGADD